MLFRVPAALVAITVGGAVASPMRPAAAARAQDPPTVRWQPATVRQGAVIRLIVSGTGAVDSGAAVHGELAGEPLHFERRDSADVDALAGIPVDAKDSMAAKILFEHGTSLDSVTVMIPVARGDFVVEKLHVAPQFGREPDSATAARIARDGERARAVAVKSHGTPRLWQLAFVAPRPGRVTSGYGRGREFNGTVQSRHLGVDYAGLTGSPVRASNRGVVALVDDFFLGGNVVYIDHGEGLVTGYLHLSKVLVSPGDTVKRGQLIGRVGATGRVTGPHLHWAVRYGNITVDGQTLLALTAPPKKR
ncbi:MAG TPA: M23 family metallopeptidase [Gemmatimonadaceae bacterium]|nr:M23 family metallopeptidase [Gemmatimonadaceae bacterium]